MDYLLDTNIILLYTRDNSMIERLEADLELFNGTHRLFVSFVAVAEIRSIAFQNNYGVRRMAYLEQMLQNFTVLDINRENILERYIEIDAYSQGNHPRLRSEFSARNMGKNDLWIAATSSVYGLTLITTDKDFEHLNAVFLEVQRVDLEEYKNS